MEVKAKMKAEKPFSYCPVCRRNHQQGRGHRYSTTHRNALQSLLGKARTRMQAIRVYLEDPRAEAEAPRRFWCSFCEQDVVEDVESLFSCSSAIRHLGSSNHAGNVKMFCGEHGADVRASDEYVFSKKDVKNWEAACQEANAHGGTSLPKNNIHQLLPAVDSRSLACVSVGPPLHVLKDQTVQATSHHAVKQTVSASGTYLTAISVKPLLPGEGNVHSGAPPPWFSGTSSGETGNSHPVELSKRKERQLKRLDKRVGAAWANKRRAELERDAATRSISTDWLPSFGRVWQHGTRRDSVMEFRAEASHDNERKQPAVQPYIGKRKRLEMELEKQQ